MMTVSKKPTIPKSIFKTGDKTAADPQKRIKQAIWLYFFLLIFEGALRKWVLPELSTPLLIVRDPIALWLLITSFNRGLLKVNVYVGAIWALMFISFCTAMAFGHGNIYVALFGLRIFVLHFPLIFLIGKVFDEDDVLKMGKTLLWIMIPMTYLMVLQFFSPQSSWINKGVGGGTETGGYWGALGYFRPPGTFSFTSGLSQFYGLAGAFIFYFWLADFKVVKKWLLLIATSCLLLSIPFSISRTLFFSLEISLLFAIVASARTPRYLSRFIVALGGGAVLLLVLSNFDFFNIGLEIFTYRYEHSNQGEGGVEGVFFDRFLGSMFGVVMSSNAIPFWGYGLGGGTNVGAVIMTGSSSFLISEGEWGRLIGEMGFILGISVIVIRALLSIKMVLRAIPAMINKNFLPWMLMSFSFLIILQGQWAQPTALGFAALSGGLVMASFRKRVQPRKFKLQ